MLVAVTLVAVAFVAVPASRAGAAPANNLLVVTDSVVLGAKGALAEVFPGWRVTVAGFPAIFTRDAVPVVASQGGAVGKVSVVATGYNYEYWDPARFDRAVDAMVQTLRGLGSERIVWVLLREATHANSPASAAWQVTKYAWYFPDVNAALRRAVFRHPELTLVDWPSVSRQNGLTYDSIHLNPAGARAMANAIRNEVDRALNGSAAVEANLRRLAGVLPAPRVDPNGADLCRVSSWPQANDQFWFAVARRAPTGWYDPDGDLVPCPQVAGAPAIPRPPSWGTGTGYPEAALRATATPGGDDGYWMADLFGTVYGFGDARAIGPHPRAVAVAIAPAGRGGYWLLGADGIVHSRGVAHFGDLGGALRFIPNEAPAAIAPARDTNGDGVADGYWIFTDRGRVFAFGSATRHGDVSSLPLDGPVVAAASTPSGRGYWMIGSDGGVFSFGDARFHGSMGGRRLDRPVVGIVADPDKWGYWLIAADGGVFSFSARFRGSMGGTRLNRPIVGAVSHGSGYLLVASDGGIFNFSDRPFHGSLGDRPPAAPVVGVASLR
jgi:hypothetical protein